MYLLECDWMSSLFPRVVVPRDSSWLQYLWHFDEAAEVKALAPSR